MLRTFFGPTQTFSHRAKFVRCWGHFCRAAATSWPVSRRRPRAPARALCIENWYR